jgi:hypothetical protein
MENYQHLSWDDIKVMSAETHQIVREFAQQSKENDQKRDKEFDRISKMFAETDQRLDKMVAETDKRLDKRVAETDKRLENMFEKSDQRLNKLGKYLGGVSHSNGEMAEEYFYNAFKADISFANEMFDTIEKNKKISNKNAEAEYDLLLFNGKSAAIIEVKYNAKPENIRIERMISRVETFKMLMPACKNFNIYLGVAAMSFKEGLEAELHSAGIATIRPVGKKMVKFDKDVKVF